MSESNTIGVVPDETGATLAARTAMSGRSLQENHKQHLTTVSDRPGPRAWMAEVKLRKRSAPSDFSRELLLAERDADRP